MNEELLAYYVNLLILQYRGKAKAEGTIESAVSSIMIYDIIRAIENGYNIDPAQGELAEGEQLDIIAKYVGADRIVTGVDFSRTYWGFIDYSDTFSGDIAGVIDYAETDPPDAQLFRYDTDQQSLYTLTDGELLDVINLKIAQNTSNHSPGSIDDLLFSFFGGDAIFVDGKNMTITYIFDDNVSRLVQIAVSQDALPKPMGVGLETSFVPDINNIFGFIDYDNTEVPDYLQGLIDYADAPYGGFLTY